MKRIYEHLVCAVIFFVSFNSAHAIINSSVACLKELKLRVMRKLGGNEGYNPLPNSHPIDCAMLRAQDKLESMTADQEEDLLAFIKRYWAYELSFFDKN